MNIIHGIQSTILFGLAYGIGTIGLSLIYKYLKFPDFTTVASMIIGGISTIYICNHSNLPFGIFSSIFFGSILGLITGMQIAYAKIPGILAGIITGTGALSLAYIMTIGGVISLDKGIWSTAEYIVPNTFSWIGLVELLVILIIVVYIISRFFKTKYGAFTLALLGTDHYLKYRHRKITITKILLLVLGNAIIGFAGSLIALHEHTAAVQSHQDFLIVAIGGYSLGSFLLQLLSSRPMKRLLNKEKKPSSNWLVQIVLFLTTDLNLNDEEPKKIFFVLLFYSASATIINIIFKSVETVANIGNNNFVFKAIILLGVLLLSNWYNKMAKSFNIQ
jgi:putative tryptophan/tyrosine transport system permease protein